MAPITLEKIFVYPLKSAAGIELTSAQINNKGICNDRRWMLVDGQGNFLSQRKFAAMATIKTTLQQNNLLVTLPNGDSVLIPEWPEQADKMRVNIWSDQCGALKYGQKFNQFFSEFLGTECFLVTMDKTYKREIDADYAMNAYSVNFPDGFPFLLISKASLQEVNDKSAVPIAANRFRANFIISNQLPFEEDRWQRIKIGNIVFEVAKPCARCNVPMIDQSTAQKGKEPLQSMAKYRKFGGEIYFGQNLIHHQCGMIKVKERLEILEYKSTKRDL